MRCKKTYIGRANGQRCKKKKQGGLDSVTIKLYSINTARSVIMTKVDLSSKHT